MIFTLKTEKPIEFPDDFADLIPPNFSGEVLNYGQGEGQIRIEDTVWGFYYGKEECCVQFEEGTVELEKFNEITIAVKANLEERLGCSIAFILRGIFNSEIENSSPENQPEKKAWWRFNS